MQPLSPKKYIETKVRNLPIDTCYVNIGWQQAGLANVFVFRRHINNNISGAVYLVDLKCLGVKDTMWFFNEVEEAMLEKLGGADLELERIDYEVAHNIVYAGHDFAMDYEIHPHKEFATSRFVLEEDTDAIPLVEIAVGEGPDSKPHLIEHQNGQYADALAKLKRLAGEGNYFYTTNIGSSFGDGEDDFLDDGLDEDDDYDEDEDEEVSIADIPPNEIMFSVLERVPMEDLVNAELVNTRNEFERSILKIEGLLRLNLDIDTGNEDYTEPHIITDLGYKQLDIPNEYSHGIDSDDYEKGRSLFNTYIHEIEPQGISDINKQAIFSKHLSRNYNSLFFLQLVFESFIGRQEYVYAILSHLKENEQLPIFKLLVAYYRYKHNLTLSDSETIINSFSIADVFHTYEGFDANELAIYHALQTLRHARNGTMPSAISHYDLLTATEDAELHLFLLFNLFSEFIPALEKYVVERI